LGIIGQPKFCCKKTTKFKEICPFCVNYFVITGVIILYRDNSVYFNLKGNFIMKLIATLIASAFAVTAFAAEPAKKEEKKVEAKPAVTAPAPAASTPAKSEPAKKDAPKADAKAATTK
jgi:hypothetical protein